MGDFDVEEVISKTAYIEEFNVFWLKIGKILYTPITLLGWLLIQPLNLFTHTVAYVKAKQYDIEKTQCPGCGFRGDSGTNLKVCTVEHKATRGHERAANEHVCIRCRAIYYSALVTPADKWIAR